MSSPDKLHRNDKGKHHRKRQRPKGARRADNAHDAAADVDASKRMANLSLNNAAKPAGANGTVASASDTDLMKPDFASTPTSAASDRKNDTDLMKPDFASAPTSAASGRKNDTDLMRPDFASTPSAASGRANDTDLMRPDFASTSNGAARKNDTDLMRPDFASTPKDARLAGIVADLEVGPAPKAKPAGAAKDARLDGIVADLEVGPAPKAQLASAPKDARLDGIVADLEVGPAPNAKPAGVGRPPDPKQNADVMQTFREVNGDQGRGAPPSADNRAEVMQMFREVNGDQGRGAPPDPKQNADVMQMFREVNDPSFDSKGKDTKQSPQQGASLAKPAAQDARLAGIVDDLEVGPASNAKPAGVGRPPDPKQNADVMQTFREVNGDQGRGAPPDPKQNADVMEMSREVNDPAFDSKGKDGKQSPQQPAQLENKPASVKDRVAAIENKDHAADDKKESPQQPAHLGAKGPNVKDRVAAIEGKDHAADDKKQSPQQPAFGEAKQPVDPDVLAMFNEVSDEYDHQHKRPHKHDQSLSVASTGGDKNASPVAGHLMNAPLGGAEMPLNIAPITQGSNAQHSASVETSAKDVMQHANDLDPAKRLAKVAIAQVEESLETKNPAQKKKKDGDKDDAKNDVKHDAKHHDQKDGEKQETETEQKVEDKKPELAGHDENVKDAKQGGDDHVHRLGDQLSAKDAQDAKNLTLDAKLQKGPQSLVAGVQNNKLGLPAGHDPLHLIDGHATGVLGAIQDAKQPLKVDGHGTGLDDKHGPNQKVDGHGTGLELGNDLLHKQAKNQNNAEGVDADIADTEGNVHKYDPMSGKAPAPKATGHATGGFPGPAPKPKLPPAPPGTANQQALDKFIETARADRDAARKNVKATQLAKSTAITVDASHLKQQVEAKNAAKLAEIKKKAEADKAKAAQEAAEKQKTEGPVTVESLREKLEAKATEDRTKLKTDFDAKNAELKTRLDSQKAVLKDQVDAQIAQIKKDQEAKKAASEKAFADQKKSLEKTRDALVTEIRKNVAKDQTALEKEMQKGGKLWTAANAKITDIQNTSKTNQDKTHNDGYAKADGIQRDATTAAQAERSKGSAAGSKAYAEVMAKKSDDTGFFGEMQLQAQARGASDAARAPFDQRARDLETKGKLDCTSMKKTIDAQVQKLKIDGEAAVKAVNDATAGQVKAIETKIQDLSKIADGRIKKAEDDYTANVAKKQAELTESLKGSEAKIQKLKDEGDTKIANLEKDAVAKLQKDFDAALKAIDTRVKTAEDQLKASNGKNLKALEQMVNQTCAAIDKQVVDTEKKFDHTVQDADKQASAFIAAQLAKVQVEAQHALDAIDKTYQDCLKMADDAVEAAHKSIEDASKGKMLEIEVHIGTLMKDCGDDSRYKSTHDQLEYYVKNKLPLPAGYGEKPPAPAAEAKKEDPNKPAAAGDDKGAAKSDAKDGAKPAEPKKEEDPVSAEAQALKAEQEQQKKLLESNDLSDPKVLEAHVQEAMKKGQTATGAAAAEDAKQSVKTSMAQASETVQKAFNTKAVEMKKVEAGDPEALKEVRAQEQAEDNAKKRADEAKKAMDKPGMLWGKNPDKKAVLKAMEGMNEAEAEAFKAEMKAKGVNIDEFVEKEMSEDQKKEARLRLKGDDIGADIAALTAAGGHHMTGNEKLATTIGAGLVLGPLGLIGAAGATSGDQNIGVDQTRLKEILDKYKDNPAKLEELKKQLEATGVPLAALLHQTGHDDLALTMDKDNVDLHKKPDDVRAEGEAAANAALQKNPQLNTAKCQQAVDKVQQSLSYILDSSKSKGVGDALAGLTPEEAAYVKAKYKAQTGHDLERDMEKQLSGVGLSTAKAELRADKDAQDVIALNKVLGAEEAGWTSVTLDDDKMKAAMKDLKDPVQRQKVLDAYEKKTGRKLTDVLAEKMTGNDRDIAVAYANGDIAKASAAEADEALNGGWMNSMHRAVHDRTKQFTGMDVDTESFTRPLVGAMVNPSSLLMPSMGDQKMNLPGGYEIQSGAIHKVDTDKLLEIMESIPNPADREKFKQEYFARTGHNLDDDVKQKTSGVTQGLSGAPQPKFDAYKALDDGRMDDYYAAKMEDAVDGVNDSKAFHKTLEGKSERERAQIIAAYKKRHPDDPDAFNHMLEEQFGKDSMDFQKAQLLATSKDDPTTGAVKLPDEFVIKYAQDSVWNRTAKAIDGATEIFDKYPILYALPIVGQAAGEAKVASYFMRGWGVDKDAIKDVLKGKSKEEIDAIRKQYKAQGQDLDADLAYALDGRDAFEVKLMLDEGEPKTEKEKIERKLKLMDFDRGNDGSLWSQLGLNKISNSITDAYSPAGGQMEMHAAELRAQLQMLEAGGQLSAIDRAKLNGALAGMDTATSGFIEARGEITGAIATAVGAVVGAVVTVLTGGVAGAILAALATGMATVGTKMVMLGNSYGRSEMGVDLAMTCVQMATAGMGGGISKLSEGFLTQVLNGAVGAAASNFAQTAMTSKDAHDLLGLLAQASKSGMVGLLSGGANAAATAALANAMATLSTKAFGPNAPLTGVMMKGFVSGAGGAVAGQLAEAMVDPDTMKGDWDAVFAKLARGAAEAGFQNGLTEAASTHHERTQQVHERAQKAVEEVKARGGSLDEQKAAFAKTMAEGYGAIIQEQEAAAKAKQQQDAAATQNPDQIQKKLDEHPPSPSDEKTPATKDDQHPVKDEKVGNGDQTVKDVLGKVEEKGATKVEEKGTTKAEEKTAAAKEDPAKADESAKPAHEETKSKPTLDDLTKPVADPVVEQHNKAVEAEKQKILGEAEHKLAREHAAELKKAMDEFVAKGDSPEVALEKAKRKVGESPYELNPAQKQRAEELARLKVVNDEIEAGLTGPELVKFQEERQTIERNAEGLMPEDIRAMAAQHEAEVAAKQNEINNEDILGAKDPVAAMDKNLDRNARAEVVADELKTGLPEKSTKEVVHDLVEKGAVKAIEHLAGKELAEVTKLLLEQAKHGQISHEKMGEAVITIGHELVKRGLELAGTATHQDPGAMKQLNEHIAEMVKAMKENRPDLVAKLGEKVNNMIEAIKAKVEAHREPGFMENLPLLDDKPVVLDEQKAQQHDKQVESDQRLAAELEAARRNEAGLATLEALDNADTGVRAGDLKATDEARAQRENVEEKQRRIGKVDDKIAVAQGELERATIAKDELAIKVAEARLADARTQREHLADLPAEYFEPAQREQRKARVGDEPVQVEPQQGGPRIAPDAGGEAHAQAPAEQPKLRIVDGELKPVSPAGGPDQQQGGVRIAVEPEQPKLRVADPAHEQALHEEAVRQAEELEQRPQQPAERRLASDPIEQSVDSVRGPAKDPAAHAPKEQAPQAAAKEQVAPAPSHEDVAHGKAKESFEQQVKAAEADVAKAKTEAAAKEADPNVSAADKKKAADAVVAAEKALEGTKKNVEKREQERENWVSAKEQHEARISEAQMNLELAQAQGDEGAIKHWEAELEAVKKSPVHQAPEGHDILSGLAKDAIKSGKTPEERAHLEELFTKVYDQVRGRSPAEIAADPVALQMLIEAHLAMHDATMQEGQTMRKVLPRDAFERFIRNVNYGGEHVGQFEFGGCVGDRRNTAGLTPEEIVARLGLDYSDTDFMQGGKGVSSIAVIDAPVTAENLPQIKDRAKIPMDPEMIKAIEAAAKGNPPNPAAKRMVDEGLMGEHKVHWGDEKNPYVGVGMSTAGERMGSPRESLSINQEKETTRATPLSVPEGTKLKIVLEDGREVVVATYKIQGERDGKPFGQFVLEPELPKVLSDKYEKMQSIEREHESTVSGGGDKAAADTQRKDQLADTTKDAPKSKAVLPEGVAVDARHEHAKELKSVESEIRRKQEAVKNAKEADLPKAVAELKAAETRREAIEETIKVKEEGRQAKRDRERARQLEIDSAKLELEAAKQGGDAGAIKAAEDKLAAAERANLMPTHAEAKLRLMEDRKLSTASAFCTVDLPKDYDQARAMLLDKKNWTPERQAFHEQVLARAKQDALAMAMEIAKARGEGEGEGTLFAMRGNTAAGKSRSLSGGGGPAELAEGMKQTGKGGSHGDEELRHRAINPDNFKKEIYENDPHLGITSNQAHEESSIMAEWLHQELLGAKNGDGTPADMVVDKRLAWMDEVQKLIGEAKATGRKMHMIDVDAELTTSFAGVLDRDGVKDPIPKADNIAGGFEKIRANRLETIKLMAAEPNAAYQLFGTAPDGSKVLIAEIKPCKPEDMPKNPLERLHVLDGQEGMFQQLAPMEASGLKAQTDALRGQKITPELIDEVTKNVKGDYRLKLRKALERHIGRTWEEAIAYWSDNAAIESQGGNS